MNKLLESVKGQPSVLAPMDGYSSWPFRSICRELGSALSYTEFVKAEDVLDRPHTIQSKLYFTESERPVIFQIYGHHPPALLEAALRLEKLGPDGIDLNLGCPNRSITRRGAGAGLMRTPLKVARIFRTLSKHLSLPLSGKIRLGWRDCQNQLLIARIIEASGGQLLAVHARTKEQGHQGPPNLAAITEIKKQISIPVLGNGGVQAPGDISHMLQETACDGVMIGRAALDNPWIFRGDRREEVSSHQVRDLLLDHLERSLSFYGPEQGVVLFRKFAAGYLAPYKLAPDIRRRLLTEPSAREFKINVDRIFSQL